MEATEVLLHSVPVHDETVRVAIAQLVRQTVPLQLCVRLHLLVNPATQDICHCLLATNSILIAIVIAIEKSYYNNGTVTPAINNIRLYLVGIERNLLLIRNLYNPEYLDPTYSLYTGESQVPLYTILFQRKLTVS